MAVITSSGPDITAADLPSFGYNLSYITDSGQSRVLNRCLQAGGPRRDGARFEPQYLDADGQLTSLPPGVTRVTYNLLRRVPSITDAQAAALFATMNKQYRLTWENGPATATFFSPVNVVSQNDRNIVFTFPDLNYYDARFDGCDVDGWPTNVTLVEVEKEALLAQGEVWDPDFLGIIGEDPANYLKPAHYRFMDWCGTNWSPQVTWADRTPPTALEQRTVSYELMINLCNRMQVDPWFCIPHMADDDYVVQLVQLVNATLDPNLTPRFEYTNEGWNYNFSQFGYLAQTGETVFGTTDLTEYQHYYGMRAAQVMRIVTDTITRTNYRRVLAWGRVQHTDNIFTASKWQAVDPDNYIAPYKLFDDFATNIYFGDALLRRNDIWTTLRDSGHAAALALLKSLLPSAPDAEITHFNFWQGKCEKYGLSFISYEGGQHCNLTSVVSLSNLNGVNLFETDLIVPDAAAFQVGETVTQSGGGSGTILRIQDGKIFIDTDAKFVTNVAVTGGTSGASQVPTSANLNNPKAGVMDLMEDWQYSDEMGAAENKNRGNFRKAGGRDITLFSDISIGSKDGFWALLPYIGADTGTMRGVQSFFAANPRSYLRTRAKPLVT